MRKCRRDWSLKAASREALTLYRWVAGGSDVRIFPRDKYQVFLRPSTKYFSAQVPSISQAKYQAKVDELAKMRRSVSPDPAKVNIHFKTRQKEPT